VDTTRDITYRDFLLNDSNIRDSIEAGAGLGKGIDGCIVDSWDLTDVDVIQFMERRALANGMDVGDVYEGARRLRMAGTLYGSTRALFYDRLDDFMAATNAVLAQREEPDDKGYRPMYYSRPTNRVEDYPDGAIGLMIKALPRSRQVIMQRDNQGGDDGHGLAIPWQANFILRDPTVWGSDIQDIDLSGGGTVSGNFENRGNYISRLDMAIEVGAAAGSIVITAGGAVLTITVPASTGDRIIRYDGFEKTLHFEESSVETLRMDLLGLNSAGAHPIIPPGTSAYSVVFNTVVPQAGSHMWWYEAYA
jgi:hypothetical protein